MTENWFFFKLVRTQVASYTGKKFLAFRGFRLLAAAFTGGIHIAVGPSAIHFTNTCRTGQASYSLCR